MLLWDVVYSVPKDMQIYKNYFTFSFFINKSPQGVILLHKDTNKSLKNNLKKVYKYYYLCRKK